jgi:hypothetical protein
VELEAFIQHLGLQFDRHELGRRGDVGVSAPANTNSGRRSTKTHAINTWAFN